LDRHWRRPPEPTILTGSDVHVWRVPLDVPPGVVADLLPLLSAEEQARAEQMVGPKVHRRFVVAHGALRHILSRYLDQEAQQIRFVAGARGKPHLASPAGAPAICFSLAHSGEFALCAVTADRHIGVDIERIRPVAAWREIAARYFSPDEQEALLALPPDRTLEAFFWAWTRKEAYSKALGKGVSQRWAQFSVSLTAEATDELPAVESETEGEGRFTILPLAPGAGYVAAVAAWGEGWRLRCWQWSWAHIG